VLGVLGHLEGADLVRAEGVCRLWREFLSSSSSLASHLWRSVRSSSRRDAHTHERLTNSN
jgi:hypothetical protein